MKQLFIKYQPAILYGVIVVLGIVIVLLMRSSQPVPTVVATTTSYKQLDTAAARQKAFIDSLQHQVIPALENEVDAYKRTAAFYASQIKQVDHEITDILNTPDSAILASGLYIADYFRRRFGQITTNTVVPGNDER